MKFDGGMILGLEDQIEPQEAVAELVDNAVDAGATRIDIVLSSGSLTVTDNGSGCDDPYNEIGTPFQSRSRKKMDKIGVKGIGGNQAMATFGRRWLIQTVTRNTPRVYRRLEMIWDPEGPLPPDYTSRQPTSSAPAELRNGGTRITVTQRQSGLDYNVERIARWLERTYRPALGRNLSITIKAPNENFNRMLRNNALDPAKFQHPPISMTGVAAGRTFTLSYGALKKPDETLQGCNVIYYPRVLWARNTVGKYALPSICFIDVQLGPEWKSLLATNKTRIREFEELNKALAELLGAWIEKLQGEAASRRINLVLGIATGRINSKIAYLDKLIEGEFGPKPRKKAEPGPISPEPKRKPDPDREIVRRRTRAYPGGRFGVEPDADSCLKLDLRPDPDLGFALYTPVLQLSEGKVTVYINTGPNQRAFERAVTSDGKSIQERAIEAAERIGWIGFAEACAADTNRAKPIFAALSKLGYDIDSTTPSHQIIRMVLNWFYDQLGPTGALRVIEGGKAA